MRTVRFGLTPVLLALALGARAATAPADDPHRLPLAVYPTLESLRLEVDPARPDYRGTARIELTARERADEVRFHAQQMTLGSVVLRRRDEVLPSRFAVDSAGVVTLTPARPLTPGPYTLAIEFSNAFDTRAAGLYRLEQGGSWYAFTQLEADDARQAFPCWDEPLFKIPWEVTLVVPHDLLAVSNAPVERETRDGDRRVVEFQRTPPLSSYLVALAVGPLDTLAIPGLAVPGRIVTPRGQARLGTDAARLAPPLLAALERYFGRPFPFAKLDLVAVPEFWYGAMENAGAITFADRVLLVDPDHISSAERYELAAVMCHEMAHQWFGDLVTMEWWDDLWLNESFATWLGTKVVDEVFPEFGAGLEGMSGVASAKRTDARPSVRAMRQRVTSADNLMQLADALAYSKGYAVLSMYERWIGPERFRAGIRDYIARFAWNNATGEDLWDALSRAGKADVRRGMPTFLDQAGLPLVRLERLSGDRVRLTQSRFVARAGAAPDETRWRIPVVIRYGEGAVVRTQSVMLTKPQQVVRLESGATADWIHPNADEAGYYRWQLDDDRLAPLASRAKRVMTARERIGFLDNLGALLDAGRLPGDAFLQSLRSLADDPDPQVLDAVLDGLERVDRTFVDEGLEPAWARFLGVTLAPALERIGERPRAGEPPAAARVRARLMVLLSDRGRSEPLLAAMEALGRTYLANPDRVPPDLADAAVELLALRGDAALWEEYRRRFESGEPADRERFLRGLLRFRDSALLARSLDYVATGPLKPQELVKAPLAAATTEARREQVFRFYVSRWDTLAPRIPPMWRGLMPRAGGGCSLERLHEAERFFADPAHQGPGWEKELVQVREAVEECATLHDRELPAVRRVIEASAPLP